MLSVVVKHSFICLLPRSSTHTSLSRTLAIHPSIHPSSQPLIRLCVNIPFTTNMLRAVSILGRAAISAARGGRLASTIATPTPHPIASHTGKRALESFGFDAVSFSAHNQGIHVMHRRVVPSLRSRLKTLGTICIAAPLTNGIHQSNRMTTISRSRSLINDVNHSTLGQR